jgi:hypothetical protein
MGLVSTLMMAMNFESVELGGEVNHISNHMLEASDCFRRKSLTKLFEKFSKSKS